MFDNVVCVDLESDEASRVQQQFGLGNVQLVRADIATTAIPGAPFFNIVAADVLEHFRDLSVPVNALRGVLGANGRLFTSLPTENWLYVALRKVFGIRKPADHYHTASEVEAFLKQSGFSCVSRRFVPMFIPLFPLFSICAWRLADDHAAL
jgi:2-polyprenyl-3-methyl-5-hydroxy-6-metoxy-1,4-benzoquinol methylase